MRLHINFHRIFTGFVDCKKKKKKKFWELGVANACQKALSNPKIQPEHLSNDPIQGFINKFHRFNKFWHNDISKNIKHGVILCDTICLPDKSDSI